MNLIVPALLYAALSPAFAELTSIYHARNAPDHVRPPQADLKK